MGFEQLAELRGQLRAEKAPAKADNAMRAKKKVLADPQAREENPAVAAIWPLQKHFPLAFPVNPTPKVPLKEGILKDAEQHLQLLGLTLDELKLGISTWCRGTRYWASMVENAPRLDLSGQPVGIVTPAQALYAEQQALKQRGHDRRNRGSQKKPALTVSADTTGEQTEGWGRFDHHHPHCPVAASEVLDVTALASSR
ncbi:MAG TPA: ProQ/FinO family protein [Pseudomonas sp.]